MTALANVCQVIPSDDGACLKGVAKGAPGKAKSGKAQLPFAETPALVKVREESKTSDSGVVTVCEKGVGGSERIVAVAPKACNPSAKGKKQGKEATISAGLPEWSPGPLAQVPATKGQPGPDQNAAVPAGSAPQSRPTGKVIVGKESVPGLPSSSAPVFQRGPNLGEPQVLVAKGLRGKAAPVAQVEVATNPTQVASRAAGSVPVGVGGQVSEKGQGKQQGSLTKPDQVASRNLETPKQDATIPEGADSPRPRQATVAVREAGGLNDPAAGKIPSKEGSVVGAPEPQPPATTASPKSHESAVETAREKPEPGPGGLRHDGQQKGFAEPDSKPSSPDLRTEVIATEVKTGRSASPYSEPHVQPELSVSSGESVPLSQRVSVQTNSQVIDNPASRSPAQNIGEQILDSVHASISRGDKQVLIRLHPPELGAVLVRFREQGEYVTGMLEVRRADTRQEIEQALPQVLRGLQDAGVQIRRFEVVASDQPERDFGRGQLPQDAGPQQHGSGQQRDHHPEPSQASWSPGGTYHSTGTEEVASLNPSVNTAQGRIDMLV